MSAMNTVVQWYNSIKRVVGKADQDEDVTYDGVDQHRRGFELQGEERYLDRRDDGRYP